MVSKATYAVLYANITVYAFCYMMQQPVLPAMVARNVTGDDKLAWAKLQTLFGGVQVVGGLLAGFLSDKLGAKFVLILSSAASAAGYLCLYFATSMNAMYLSMIPGVFQHAFMGTSAYIAGVTAPERRSQMIGYITLAYGVGMTTGSVVGGHIGETDLSMCSILAAIGAMFGALLVVFIPAASPSAAEGTADGAKPSFAGSFGILRDPLVQRQVLIQFLANTGMGIWRSAFQIVAVGAYGFGPKLQGYFMSYCSVLGMVAIGVGTIQALEDRFSYPSLMKLIGAVLCGCFALLPLTAQLPGTFLGVEGPLVALGLIVLPIVTGTSVLRSIMPSELSKVVTATTAQGTAIGLSMGISSSASIVAPTIGTYAHLNYGYTGVGCCCAALMAAMALATHFAYSRNPRSQKQD